MTVGVKIAIAFAISWTVCAWKSVDAMNVLGIVTSPLKSHHHHASAIFNELADNGHAVMVASPHQQSPKIIHYYLENIKIKKKDRLRISYHPTDDNFLELVQLYSEGVERTKAAAADPKFRKLLSDYRTVDVIILDYDFNEALLGLGEVFRCPIIVLTAGRLRGLMPRLSGLPYPLYNILNFNDHSGQGVFGTLMDLFAVIAEEFYVNFYYHKKQEAIYRGLFPLFATSFEDSYRTHVVKVFRSSLCEDVVSGDIVNIAGFHIRDFNFFKDSLPEQLDNFIHTTKRGFIYVSLGADVNPLTLPKDKLNDIIRVLYRRPEKIVWAWNGNVSAFAGNDEFYLDKWIPQNDVLQHKNIKLFITSGGQLSLIEAVHHEVPIIGIPLSSEQSSTLDQIQGQGLGLKIELRNLSEASLSWAVAEVLDRHEWFEKNLIAKSMNIEDRPLSPMKALKFWLEHAIRHSRTIKQKQRSRFAVNYYFADFYLVSLLVIVAIIVCTTFFCWFIHRLVSLTITRKKQKLY